MQAFADAVHAEQHHAEEARFEEERGQNLVAEQRPDDRPGFVGEDRPVGAELVGHDDARDDAHGEGDRKDAQPIAEDIEIDGFAGRKPQPFEHGEVARKADGEGGEQEVPDDDEGELETGEIDGARQHGRIRLRQSRR